MECCRHGLRRDKPYDDDDDDDGCIANSSEQETISARSDVVTRQQQ